MIEIVILIATATKCTVMLGGIVELLVT